MEMVMGLAGFAGVVVVGIPAGGYVYSNYITKQKTWTSWTIGAVGTAVLIPALTYGALYFIFEDEEPRKKIAKEQSELKDAQLNSA
jgi:hypothetical protein